MMGTRRGILGTVSAALLLAVCGETAGASIKIDASTKADVSATGALKIVREDTIVIEDLGIGIWDKEGEFTGPKDSSKPQVDVRKDGYSIEGKLGENLLSYRIDASKCSSGIHIRWSQVGSTENTWAIIMKLPRALFAGVDFILDGQHARTFPSSAPGNPRFFTGNGESILTARAKGTRLFVDCAQRYGIVVQDARKWGDDSYHVLIYPKEGEISLLLSLSSLKGGPKILKISENGKEIGTHQKFELTLTPWAKFTNPYDDQDIRVSAEFSQPSGRSVMVDGFIYKECLRTLENAKETFELAGNPVWKVRFSPREAGRHTYSVTVRTRRGTSPPLRGEFTAVDSGKHGFLGVSKSGTYFQFTDGMPYFAVGHNVCWPSSSSPVSDYEMYFRKMKAAGENFTRVWLCSWGINLETESVDELDLKNAWILDYLVRLAEDNGIFFKLCLENFWDFTKIHKSPYWEERGGFCRDAEDFFGKAKSREWAKRKYRYVVARWGYSPNILAWEMWNEVDYATRDKSLIIEWTREMGTYLKSIDTHNHMITTSLGVSNVWPELWKMPELDFVQIHTYINRLERILNRTELDAAKYVRQEIARVKDLGKPCLVSEFGYLVTNEDPGMNERDISGIHLHNALWSSALSGAAGTCMSWWWDNYIDKNNLYYHYECLSKFLRGEEKRMARLTSVSGEGANFRVLGLKDETGGLFWIQNKNNTWYRCAGKKKPEPFLPLKGAVLKLSDLAPGRYAIQWWDTYNGGIITEYETELPDGKLEARPPASASDIACKVKRLATPEEAPAD